MNYVVIDLEWNQPIDGKSTEERALCFEIIEIGAVLLDENRKPVRHFSRVIKPQVYRTMNAITRNIVNIPKEELNQGDLFPDAMKEFLSWCGKDYVFCTWGSGDLLELQRNIKYYELPPLSARPIAYLDVQKLYGLAFEGKKSTRSLEHAIEALNIKRDKPFHRAHSDAFYTAEILAAIKDESLLTRYSYDTFCIPGNKKEEMTVDFPDYRKYISRGFEDKNEAIRDREVSSSRCIRCGKRLKKCVRTFTPNGRYFLNVAYCEEHGYLKSKIRLKKTDEGKTYVIKTQKFITADEMAEISGRRAHTMEVKRVKDALAKQNHKNG